MAPAEQVLAVVEELDLVEMRDSFTGSRASQGSPPFERRPVRDGDALHTSKAAQETGQSKAEVSHFKQGVVTIADELAIELHDRTTPQIVDAILFLELADGLYDIAEELAEVLRGLSDLRGIFGQVFKNRPEIDQGPPIDIAQVHQEEVFFEVVDERVVALQK